MGVGFSIPPTQLLAVAVMPVNMQPEADVLAVSLPTFLDADKMQKSHIGIGDEVFLPGLFVYAPFGTNRTTPILRHGNIAMLPDSQIQIESGFADAYLIEARSIGGISGSPVFVRTTIAVNIGNEDGSANFLVGLGSDFYLLGIAQGHWDIRESDLNKVSYVHDSQRGVNLGIGIVVPANKILETINHPELVAMREKAEAEYKRAISPRADFGSKPQ